eukprot:gene40504-49370_t
MAATTANLNQSNFLKAKIQIGSVKGPISFSHDQTVFHHDDVPDRSRQRKEAVDGWKKSKILDPNYHSWSKSTKPIKPVVERRQMENYKQDRGSAYQYNYRAETLDSLKMVEPVDRSTKFHISAQLPSTIQKIQTLRATDRVQGGQLHRTQEMPVHPNLELARPWNNTTVLTVKEQGEGLNKMTDHAVEWSKKVTEILPQKKEYISPMKQVAIYQDKIRQMKLEGTFSAKLNINRPTSEPVDRTKLKNRFLTAKLQTLTQHVHSGTWDVNPLDGKSMWSDTGSYEYSSKGDILKKTNLDQQNFADAVKGSRRILPSHTQQPPKVYPSAHRKNGGAQSAPPGSR